MVSRSPIPAKQFPGYQVLQRLGAGGMGEVFEAVQLQSQRRVVLKTLQTDRDDHKQRFRREALALAQLSHPNIVRVFEYNQTLQGEPFYAMEFLDGADLSDFLVECQENDEELSLDEILELFRSLAEALVLCHKAGMVHRDIKPSNVVMAERDGVLAPVLVDFGLVKFEGDSLRESLQSLASDLTKENAMIGTPAYMAPEQFIGDSAQHLQKTDVWALGATLYFVLTRQTPFGFASTMTELLGCIMNERVPSVSSLRAGIPWPIEQLCMDSLVRDPERRLGSEQFLARVEDLLKNGYERRRPVSLAVKLSIVAFFVLVGVGVAWAQWPSAKVITTDLLELKAPAVTNQSQLTLRGRVKDDRVESVMCKLKGQKKRLLWPVRDGQFEGELSLHFGINSFKLVGRDSSGQVLGQVQDFAIEVDREPPKFKLEALPKRVVEDHVMVRGHCAETGCEVKLQGSWTEVAGAFELKWGLQEGDNSEDFSIRDAAGNVVSRPLKCQRALRIDVDASFETETEKRFRSIEAAIKAAPEGAVIVVAPGRYVNPTTMDKALVLRGASKQDRPFLASKDGRSIAIEVGGVVLENLNIEILNLGPTAGIYSFGPSFTLRNCRVRTTGQAAIGFFGRGLVGQRGPRTGRMDIEDCEIRCEGSVHVDIEGGRVRFVDTSFLDVKKGGLTIAQSKVSFKNCQWLDGLFGVKGVGLNTDLDFVDCQFVKIGNFGLSLALRAKARMSSCLLERCGLKQDAALVADFSKLRLVDCKLVNGRRAIYTSSAEVDCIRGLISGFSGTAVTAYNESTVKLQGVKFSKNAEPVRTTDPSSKILGE